MSRVINLAPCLLVCAFICAALIVGGCAPSDAGPKELLFEVLTDASMSVYPPGKTLTLRAFSNGDVEFDFYFPHTPDRPGYPFRSEIKNGNITGEQLETFKSLLKEIDSESSNTEYKPTRLMMDAWVIVTLKYRSKTDMKQIILKENDSHLHLEQTGKYPPALTKLLSLAKEISWAQRRKLVIESTKTFR